MRQLAPVLRFLRAATGNTIRSTSTAADGTATMPVATAAAATFFPTPLMPVAGAPRRRGSLCLTTGAGAGDPAVVGASGREEFSLRLSEAVTVHSILGRAAPSSHRGSPAPSQTRRQAAAVAARMAQQAVGGPLLLTGTPRTVEGALAPCPGQARVVVSTQGPSPRYTLQYANEDAEELLGLKGDAVAAAAASGKLTLGFLVGPASDTATLERLFGALRAGGRAAGETVVYTATALPRYVRVQVSPLLGRDGSQGSHALLVLTDVLSDDEGLCDDHACFG